MRIRILFWIVDALRMIGGGPNVDNHTTEKSNDQKTPCFNSLFFFKKIGTKRKKQTRFVP